MKKKRLVALAMIASLCIPVLPASASVDDSTFPTEYITHTSGAYTDSRKKEDDTSVYVFNKSAFDIFVWVRHNDVNLAQYGHVKVPSGAENLVINYVYERGYRDCYLYIAAAKPDQKGYSYGRWSPDSVGNYPIAKP